MIVRYSVAAKLHLIRIWRCSRERWGDERADRYVRTIDEKVVAVADGSRRARPCPDIQPGLSVVRSESHNVYVRVEAGEVRVVAVLHMRMDQKRRLRRKK